MEGRGRKGHRAIRSRIRFYMVAGQSYPQGVGSLKEVNAEREGFGLGDITQEADEVDPVPMSGLTLPFHILQGGHQNLTGDGGRKITSGQ